jgi:hypothetical protein
VAFLVELAQSGHDDEALLLCCCYIEGLGQWFYPNEKSSWRCFVRVLREHSGNEFLGHVVPGFLVAALTDKDESSAKKRELAVHLLEKFRGKEANLYAEPDFLKVASTSLNAPSIHLMKKELWRGTVASGGYQYIRCTWVHGIFGGSAIVFPPMTYKGKSPPRLEFSVLHSALCRLVQKLTEICIAAGADPVA